MKWKNLMSINFKTVLVSVKNRLFLVFVSILILPGCYQYQYITLNSNMSQNEKKEFIVENDTASIKYTFAGENCPITIGMYNKLKDTIYINWAKSAVIINGKKISYFTDKPSDEQISSIPPQTYVENVRFTLRGNFFKIDFSISATEIARPINAV